MTAIVDLGTLKAAIATECSRSGVPSFTAMLPQCVQGAEEMIFIGSAGTEPVRVAAMETSTDLTFTNGAATLPVGFLQQTRLYWDSDLNIVPRFVTLDEFYAHRSRETGHAFALRYTVEGTSMLISPASSGTGKLRYYAKPAALSADTDTNWLLTNVPSLYFSAACFHAYRYLRNDAKVSEHLGAFQSAVAAVQRYDLKSIYSGRYLAPAIPRAT